MRQYIFERLKGATAWVLVGGPPCQAYSIAGRSRMKGMAGFESDERHFLYKEYLHLIADHSPPVFILENVKGLASATIDGESTLQKILADLRNPEKALGHQTGSGVGYHLHGIRKADTLFGSDFFDSFLLRAEEHGVPQARHRLFIIGVRGDIKLSRDSLILWPKTPPTVAEMIGNMPKIRSGVTQGADDDERWRKALEPLKTLKYDTPEVPPSVRKTLKMQLRAVLAEVKASLPRMSSRYPEVSRGSKEALHYVTDHRLGALPDHSARAHMPGDLRRYMFAATYARVTGRSPVLKEFPIALLPNHSNVTYNTRGGVTPAPFADRFRVQLRERVASTVTSHISKDGNYYIHYDPLQCRSLTVREAARLQTFPDNYLFAGTRTAQYHQIGNAVPPLLARHIGNLIAKVLDVHGGGI